MFCPFIRYLVPLFFPMFEVFAHHFSVVLRFLDKYDMKVTILCVISVNYPS